MTKEQAQVKHFQEKAGCTVNTKPTIPVFKDALLRVRLIEEELNELRNAMVQENIIEVADAIGDLLYVVIGTAVTYGIDIDPIFQEVHVSNMSKFIDGHLDSHGKWIKGPSYQPANLAPILAKQKESNVST